MESDILMVKDKLITLRPLVLAYPIHSNVNRTGPSCSKLTTSLVNETLDVVNAKVWPGKKPFFKGENVRRFSSAKSFSFFFSLMQNNTALEFMYTRRLKASIALSVMKYFITIS